MSDRSRVRPGGAVLLLLLIGIALAAAACRGPAAGGADKSAAQAAVPKGNRILSVYTALDPNESQIYFKAYQEQTGVVVRWVSMSSGAVFARVLAEKNNPSMGLWFGGPATDFIAATEQGLLAPYKPNIDFDLPDNSHDPNWNWSGLYFGAIGFAANTKRLARLGIKPPESWADLLDPKLKGEIGVAYPYTSGTAFTFLASLIEIMGGEDKAFDYIKRLNENVHHYNKSGSSCVTQVGLGEIAVGIAFSHDILKKGPGRGYPVVLKAPKEGTGFEIGAMALIKNGPDREEAKKFIDWMLSVKGQNMMQEWYRIPLNPKATVGVGAVTADKVKLAKDNIVWAGKNKARLIEHWRTITAQ